MEKKAEEEGSQEAEEVPDVKSEENAEEETTDPNIDNRDLEAELEREREARRKSDEKLRITREKSRESWEKRQKQDETEEIDEEKPLTATQLEAILARDREESRKEIQGERVVDLAGRLARTELEKRLVVEIFNNRTFPEHLSLPEQVEEAFVIANRKKILSERNEALRALEGKRGVVTDTASVHQDAPTAGGPKIAPVDAQALKDAGFSFNGTTRRWEKKLSSGNILVRDPKTNKTYQVKP